MPTSGLTLTLFGSFEVAAGGVPPGNFATDKVRALLAYLAVEADRAHSRSSLATLLWPEVPDEIALRNLRKTLHRLHVALSPSLSATEKPVLATRQTIQLDPRAWTVDVGTFQDLLDASAAHPHRALHLCQPCLDRLSQVTTLYRGELLAGFGLSDAEPFEEWLLLKREYLLHRALQALYDLAAAHLEREEYEQAYTYAARQVELDPGREEAHRQALLALALNGQRSEALAYFERCRQMLMETLGVEPAPQTLNLVDQIQRQETLQVGAPSPSLPGGTGRTQPRNLPTQLTPFLGRTPELLQIGDYLRDADCRLVSILGPGGVGKTRLAVKAADQAARQGRWADHVVFVPLAEVRSAQLLPSALADGLGLELVKDSDARAQLLSYLRSRQCLLVLDNFEQLLDAANLLVDILTSTPHVRMLVTSRLPLGLRMEQRLYLQGLDYPEQEDEPAPSPSSLDEIAGAGGVQAFVQAARRIEPGFTLTPSNAQDVLCICQLVAGMPLALELAAPWIRVMDCAAIAAAIEQSLALLATTASDVPERHRSMEAVLTQSWSLLTQDQQAAAAQLSVFHGPFDLDAAARVASVTIIDLAAFVDTCLVQRTSDGRYQLHELLRQFGAQMLSHMVALDSDAVEERHSDYYLGLAAANTASLYGPNSRKAVRSLRSQLGNIRRAWSWAARHTRLGSLTRSLDAMVRFWELAGLFDEADDMLAQAVEGVQDGRPALDSASRSLLVQLLVWQAHFHEVRSRVGEAIETAEAALALARSGDDVLSEAEARSVLGEALPHRDQFGEARSQLEQACNALGAQKQGRGLARALRRLGVVHWRAGEYGRAVEYLTRARAMQQELGDHWELAQVQYSLGGVAFEQGNLEEARNQAEGALLFYEAIGDRRNSSVIGGNLAMIYSRLGYVDLALQRNQSDLDMSRELGDAHGSATSLGNRGWIYVRSGDLDQALRCFREAMEIEDSLASSWDAARHRSALAHVLHLQGRADLALIQFARALPVLRAHGARYYAVEPLLQAAELNLDVGRLDDASDLVEAAVTLAEELGLSGRVEQSRALAVTIADARAERRVLSQP